jgi:hypothetical protein
MKEEDDDSARTSSRPDTAGTNASHPRDAEDEDSPDGWLPLAKIGLLLVLLIGSIALTSMCSNRGIGKIFRRLEHRYGGED